MSFLNAATDHPRGTSGPDTGPLPAGGATAARPRPGQHAAEPRTMPCTAADRLAFVRRFIADRAQRARFFDRGWFSDPVWDMLLDCHLAQLLGREQTVSNLCIASGVSPTTALRHLQALTRAGLITRTPDRNDRRRIFVSLSDTGSQSMQSYFDSISGTVVSSG